MITKEELSSVFAGFDGVVKTTQERVSLDISKVAIDIADATKNCKSADGDPEEKIIALAKFVDEMAELLEKAEVDEETLEVFFMQDPVVKTDDDEDSADSDTDIDDADSEPKDIDATQKNAGWADDMAPARAPVGKSKKISKAASSYARVRTLA